MSERSEDGGRWYFSRKEIEDNSPSRSDGIDLKKETYLRKSYCTFLQDLGMRLKVSFKNKSLYFQRKSRAALIQSLSPCPRLELRYTVTVATACMFLAGKVEETPRPLKDVILVSYEIIHKKDPAAAQKIKQKEVYEQQKELILVGERVVLATLGFDLDVQHPYKPLVEAIKKFKVAQHALAQVAWNFVNDGLRTSLCLQFESHHVAAGAIFLAAKFLKVKLPSDGEVVWWQEFDVTPRQLEEVSNQMLELYEQNKAPTNQGSEAEGSVAGGAANRAASRTSTDDHVPTSTSSQGGAQLKPATTHILPEYSNKHGAPPKNSQNKSSDYGSVDHKSLGEPRASEPPAHQYSIEDSKERNVGGSRTIEEGENYHGNNLDLKEAVSTKSPPETIEKIDANKLKELREKRKKSRGDVIRKKDIIDEFDPIVKELEEGVELAAAQSEKIKLERKQNWSQLSAKLDRDSKYPVSSGDRRHVGTAVQQSNGTNPENVEEGEVSTLDDSSMDYHSNNKSNDRKRKSGSPGEKASDVKRRRDSTPGELYEEMNQVSRVDYPEKDYRRHDQENNA
ncbi:hypothetical protein KSS87_013997 [Heliosperma pusillum]|nr:hypothetical protein KSS87_013997 [Heliosperma pusillum]